MNPWKRGKNEKRQSSLMYLNGRNNLLLILPNLSFCLSYSFTLHSLHNSDDISQHIIICPNWTLKRREKFFSLLLKFRPHKIVSRDFSYQSPLLCWLQTRHHQYMFLCIRVNVLNWVNFFTFF